MLGYPRVCCGAGNPGPLCVVYSLKYAGNPGTLSVRESLFNSIQIIHLEISLESCEERGLRNILRHFNFFEIRWRAIVIWAYLLKCLDNISAYTPLITDG